LVRAVAQGRGGFPGEVSQCSRKQGVRSIRLFPDASNEIRRTTRGDSLSTLARSDHSWPRRRKGSDSTPRMEIQYARSKATVRATKFGWAVLLANSHESANCGRVVFAQSGFVHQSALRRARSGKEKPRRSSIWPNVRTTRSAYLPSK